MNHFELLVSSSFSNIFPNERGHKVGDKTRWRSKWMPRWNVPSRCRRHRRESFWSLSKPPEDKYLLVHFLKIVFNIVNIYIFLNSKSIFNAILVVFFPYSIAELVNGWFFWDIGNDGFPQKTMGVDGCSPAWLNSTWNFSHRKLLESWHPSQNYAIYVCIYIHSVCVSVYVYTVYIYKYLQPGTLKNQLRPLHQIQT